MESVFVIVPTFNESENIQLLLPMLLDLPVDAHVIVVDDNSPDGTGQLADEIADLNPERVKVIHRSGKLGLGTAYLAGMALALESGATRIFTMDADFSHHPRYIPKMVEASANYDLVIGSRYVAGGGTPDFPPQRILLSSGANFFARTMLGLRAHDATAGFRCYQRRVLEQLPLDTIFSNGYSFLIEMLFLVQGAGFTVAEVPIIFEDRKLGTSKISEREIIRALETVFRLFGRRLGGLFGR